MGFAWYPISPKGLRSIAESTARLNIWHGAVRSSKTICSIIRWIEYLYEGPPGHLLMFGKTERTLKRNILDPLEQIVGTRNFEYNRGLGELYCCGRTIYTVGANDERAEGKIRGVTLAGAYGDELTICPETFFKQVLSRLSVKGSKFFGTTNPGGPYHWLKKDFLEREGQLNLRSWHFNLDDNLGLDPEYVQALKAEYTGLWYKRFILGLWVMAEGAVYDMFDEDVHVVTDLPEMTQYWVGIDYGTTNPTVFLLIGAGVDKRLYVVDEWRYDSKRYDGRHKTDQEYHRALFYWLQARKVRPRWIFVDPSASSFITQISRPGQLRIPNVALASNDVLEGIRWTSSLLESRRLLVHKRCQGLIDELYGYTWDSRASEKGKDAPLQQDDHGPDALRYAVLSTIDTWMPWLGPNELRAA